ncbi:M48 family metalloprotease [Guyparkeria hydrothermalis]|uniref:M48 family metalloprotease n=1 Tax=Guyparkeria hydrothermalis TaxID=923 RepID=UPI0020216A0E|nr:M48 family metalloprotease [Guyparkeria hydrothermalis]MCL7745358.1 M48 family metalloprotease [Guyparkeria hydrothermalis]
MNKSIRATLASILAFAVLVGQPAMAEYRLPELGTPADTVLSPEDEREIGAKVFEQLREQGGVIEDALIDSYLNDLGVRLMSSSSGTRFAPNLVVVDNSTINAFTVPGGHIAVFSGLILTAENESELSGVIAHEIAHATQRHIAEMVAAQTGNNLTAIAGFIAGALLGAVNPQLGAAVATAGIAGAAQNAINYTRMHEREADRLALDTLKRADIDPRGMISFFEKLQRRAGGAPSRQFEFLRTHPMTAERISSIKDRIARLPEGEFGQTDSEAFRLARARLAGLQGESGLGLDDTAETYRRAVAAQRNGRHDQAVDLLEPLHAQQPGNRWFALPLARALNDQGNAREADRILDELIALYPGDATLMRVEVEWMLDRGDTETAYRKAREAVESRPDDPEAALALSKAASAADRPLEHHEQLGRYFLLKDNLVAAHQELETAYTFTADNPRAQARIESTLEEIERRAGQTEDED